MKTLLLLALAVSPAFAAVPDARLSVSSEALAEPLTTERAAELDPGLINPHRARWALKREVTLEGLQAVELRAGFGVRAAEIRGRTGYALRGPGPWYRDLTEFPCGGRNPVFATPEGSRRAAQHAVRAWEQRLASEKPRLDRLFRQIASPTPGVALKKATDLFDEWLHSAEYKWRDSAFAPALAAEWKHYADEVAAQGVCAGKANASRERYPDRYPDRYEDEYDRRPLVWETAMEPLPPAIALGAPLARGPAKRWAGLYSIRLNVIIAGRKLNGRFLVDTGIGRSVMSPEWLESQGIIAAWIAQPGVPFVRIPWGAAEGGDRGGLAAPIRVDQVEIGNTPVALRDFALYDSVFFEPPESAGTCCDGVLGTDFLRERVVEFRPGPPAEVNFWAPMGFSLPESEYDWFEVALSESGEAQSACSAKSPGTRIAGVRWDTGREAALDIHLPWQKAARGSANSWRFGCGPNAETPLATNLLASFPPSRGPESIQVREKSPGVSAGIALLGRSRFFLDLPHGRIWFPKRADALPLRFNRTGLQLKFGLDKLENRVLLVDSVQPAQAGTPAGREALRKLVRLGLQRGQRVTLLDQEDPGGLNQWEVNRRLAGDDGEAVLLQWRTPHGLRLGKVPTR